MYQIVVDPHKSPLKSGIRGISMCLKSQQNPFQITFYFLKYQINNYHEQLKISKTNLVTIATTFHRQ